jgi:urocanate hydratase
MWNNRPAGGKLIVESKQAMELLDAGYKEIVRAPRGTTLRLQGVAAGSRLRMLMNNLDPDVAERPEDLNHLRRHGQGRAQLGVLSRHRRRAEGLANDETLLVQSGKPVGVFPDARARRAC